jgi:trk system potassium uptake protein TrkA
MHIVVVGAGEVGYYVAERLSGQQHDVVVVDVDGARLEYVANHLDVGVVEGSGTSGAVLEQAGIGHADLLLAVTSVDEVNLVCAMSARGSERIVKIARVSNPDFYADQRNLRPEAFGVDVLINPERELALETMRLLKSTAATEVAVFAGGSVQLLGVTVTADARVVGHRLADVAASEGDRPLLTVALDRDGRTLIPSGQTEIRAGDHLYLAALPEEIPHAMELLGYEHTRVRRVMITGGSVEAFYLCELLQQHRVETTLLVSDRQRAQELAEKLGKVLVLQADPTDIELLELEGAGGADGFVAMTEADELNIISSLVAKQAGAHHVITVVNKKDYIPVCRRVGLDAAVSPRLSAANAILRYLRPGSVTRVVTLGDNEAEAISFDVTEASPVAGHRLADVEFPPGSIVAAVTRGQKVFVPRGTDTLEVGDAAIVFALREAVARVTELFPR